LSEARLAARRQADRERAERARAEANLVERSGTSLSAWEPLGTTETELFLDFLSLARESRGQDGTASGVSSDGRWTVRLTQTSPPATAIIHTPDGRLALADAVIEFISSRDVSVTPDSQRQPQFLQAGVGQ